MDIIKNSLLVILSWSISIGILLLDPDSALHITTAPAALLAIGSVGGNVIWLLGVLLLAGAIVLTILTFSDKAMENSLYKARIKGSPVETFKPYKLYETTLMSLSGILALAFLGSGYWFTGTAWVAIICVNALFRAEFNKAVKEFVGSELDERAITLRAHHIEAHEGVKV